MKLLGMSSLTGRILAIVFIVVVVDFFINSLLFEHERNYVLDPEEVSWMAEQVSAARSTLENTASEKRPALAQSLSNDRFKISWYPARDIDSASNQEPQQQSQTSLLTDANLELKLITLSLGSNVSGSMLLQDGSAAYFRFSGEFPWPLKVGRFLGIAAPSALLMLLAWAMFRIMLKPLRDLVRATSEVGTSDPQPLPEAGSGEILHLIRSFNIMQERIHQLLESGSQTLLAIAHDFRTPLARLQLRIESAKMDPTLRNEIAQDIDEMRDLLQSLQTYVESGQDQSPLEGFDVAVTAQTLVDNAQDRGYNATYAGPDHLELITRPSSVRRAISNIIENALLYANEARVTLLETKDDIAIIVEDNGPGIPEDQMANVLLPFIRLDNARARNTAGMGLGIPIVVSVIKPIGGTFSLCNRPSGGLRATIRLPKT